MLDKAIEYFFNPVCYFVTGQQCDNVAGRIVSAGGSRFSDFEDNTTPNGTFLMIASVFNACITDLE